DISMTCTPLFEASVVTYVYARQRTPSCLWSTFTSRHGDAFPGIVTTSRGFAGSVTSTIAVPFRSPTTEYSRLSLRSTKPHTFAAETGRLENCASGICDQKSRLRHGNAPAVP